VDPDRLGPLFVVGAGRVGSALATLWVGGGIELLGLWTRSEQGARQAGRLTGLRCHHGAFPADIGRARTVIIAVPDGEVATVAGALLDGGLLRSADAVLHCGGANPADQALAPLEHSPCRLGTLHPLLAVADAGQAAARLPGACFAVEGEAQGTASALVAAIGARAFEVEGEAMALYHTAAVLASNHTVTLWHAACQLLEQAGLDAALAAEALLPLVQSTVDNVATLGLPQALTGPVRRGDLGTVERHLAALAREAPALLPLYRACTLQAARIAEEAGADDEELRRALEKIRRRVQE